METPGSGGGATVSGSPGRAEQGVAGVPPGIGTYGCQGTACQAGCEDGPNPFV